MTESGMNTADSSVVNAASNGAAAAASAVSVSADRFLPWMIAPPGTIAAAGHPELLDSDAFPRNWMSVGAMWMLMVLGAFCCERCCLHFGNVA